MGNMRVTMNMMTIAIRSVRTACGCHLKGRSKQGKLDFHYALQRIGTAVRPSWFDFLCGEAGRLIDQCGDKRASSLTNFGDRKSSRHEQIAQPYRVQPRSICWFRWLCFGVEM